MHKRKDYYYLRAKQENYLARSAYKLEELDAKFGLFKGASAVLDLGAAPGSWTQYLLRAYPSLKVVAVDLLEVKIAANPRLTVIQEDFTQLSADLFFEIQPSYQAVISDAAPNTTGNRFSDVARSLELCEQAARLAHALLPEGGWFVAKAFEGHGFSDFTRRLQREFSSVKLVKPRSSQKGSRELFIVARKEKKGSA